MTKIKKTKVNLIQINIKTSLNQSIVNLKLIKISHQLTQLIMIKSNLNPI